MALQEAVAIQGILMKRSDNLRRWRSRWFFLPRGSSSLLYRASEDDANLRGTISLINASVGIIEAPANLQHVFCFYIQSPRGTYALAAESEAVRAQWMTMIDMAAAGASIQAAAWAAAAAAARCQMQFDRKDQQEGPLLATPDPQSDVAAGGFGAAVMEKVQTSAGGVAPLTDEGAGLRENGQENRNVELGGGAGEDKRGGTCPPSTGGQDESESRLSAECHPEGGDGLAEGITGEDGKRDGDVSVDDGSVVSAKEDEDKLGDISRPAGASEALRDEKKAGRLPRLADAQASLLAAWTTLRDHPRTRSFTSIVSVFGSAEASDNASCQSSALEDGGEPGQDEVGTTTGAVVSQEEDERDEFDTEEWSMAEEAALEAPAGVGIQRAYFGLSAVSDRSRSAPIPSAPDSSQAVLASGSPEADAEPPGLTWLEGAAAATLDQHAAWQPQEPSQVWATEPRRGLLAQAKQWVKWEGSETMEPLGILQEMQLKYENLAITLERAAEALRAKDAQMADLQVQASSASQELERVKLRVKELEDEALKAKSQWTDEAASLREEAAKQLLDKQAEAEAEMRSLEGHVQQAERELQKTQQLLQDEQAEKELLQEKLATGP